MQGEGGEGRREGRKGGRENVKDYCVVCVWERVVDVESGTSRGEISETKDETSQVSLWRR